MRELRSQPPADHSGTSQAEQVAQTRDMILPSGLLHGLRSYEEIYAFTGAQLRDIIADEQTHRQLVAESEVSLHLLLPHPHKASDRYHSDVSGLVV